MSGVTTSRNEMAATAVNADRDQMEPLDWHEAVAAPFPAPWREILAERVPFYHELRDDERQRFEDKVKVFVYTKTFGSPDDLPVTQEMRVVVAAAACRLTMNMSWEDYAQVRHVVLRAQRFASDDGEPVAGLGGRHVVTVSWPDLVRGLADPHDGYNIGYHEFAHALDGSDGDFNGEPPGPASDIYQVWTEVMANGRQAVTRALRDGVDPPIDGYAATDDAEFFAVATEWFFERPRVLRGELPAVYDVLRRFYHQDPAAAGEADG